MSASDRRDIIQGKGYEVAQATRVEHPILIRRGGGAAPAGFSKSPAASKRAAVNFSKPQFSGAFLRQALASVDEKPKTTDGIFDTLAGRINGGGVRRLLGALRDYKRVAAGEKKGHKKGKDHQSLTSSRFKGTNLGERDALEVDLARSSNRGSGFGSRGPEVESMKPVPGLDSLEKVSTSDVKPRTVILIPVNAFNILDNYPINIVRNKAM